MELFSETVIFLDFALFVSFIVFSFALPVKKPLVERSSLGQLKCKIGANEVDNLSDELITWEPNVILLVIRCIGNAVDQRVFENAVEQKTMVVWSGGSSSAWWYLVVKNVIIPSPAKPKYVTVFFNEEKYNDKLFHFAQVKEETDLDNKNNYSFHPERTFGPHIIKLCKENDVELIFLRVKRKRDVFDNNQPVELMSYQEKLRIYLEEKEVSFIDYSKNSSIRSEHFDKGDHLSLESGMPLFTRIFSEKFTSLFLLNISVSQIFGTETVLGGKYLG